MLRAICFDNLVVDLGQITSIINFHNYVTDSCYTGYTTYDEMSQKSIRGLGYRDKYGTQMLKYGEPCLKAIIRRIDHTFEIDPGDEFYYE